MKEIVALKSGFGVKMLKNEWKKRSYVVEGRDFNLWSLPGADEPWGASTGAFDREADVLAVGEPLDFSNNEESWTQNMILDGIKLNKSDRSGLFLAGGTWWKYARRHIWLTVAAADMAAKSILSGQKGIPDSL